MSEKQPKLDRSSLLLPLTRSNISHTESEGSSNVRGEQQKLMKSYSTPAESGHTVKLAARQGSVPASSSSKKPLRKRAQSIQDTIYSGTAKFFGVPQSDTPNGYDPSWNSRRLRFICRRYGNYKETAARELTVPTEDYNDIHFTPLPTPVSDKSTVVSLGLTDKSYLQDGVSRSKSEDSRSSMRHAHLEWRDSVIKMAYDHVTAFLQRGTLRPRRSLMHRNQSISSSFSPYSVRVQTPSMTSAFIKEPTISEESEVRPGFRFESFVGDARVHSAMPISVRAPSRSFGFSTLSEITERSDEMPEDSGSFIRRADEIKSCTNKQAINEKPVEGFQSAAFVVARGDTERGVCDHEGGAVMKSSSRDKVPLPLTRTESLQDEVFFDVTPTSPEQLGANAYNEGKHALPMGAPLMYHTAHAKIIPAGYRMYEGQAASGAPGEIRLITAEKRDAQQVRHRGRPGVLLRQSSFETDFRKLSDQKLRLQKQDSLQEAWERTAIRRKRSFLGHIQETLSKYRAPDKRGFGEGFGIWRFFCRRKMKHESPVIDTYVDYRPYFTYWVTTVQILVMIASITNYGIGPFGFGRRERTAFVLDTSVTLRQVEIYEQENVWLGPKFADLVLLGAKFTPCMRHDPRIFAQIEEERRKENGTACCVHVDGTGCFQTGRESCPTLIATFMKWDNKHRGPDGRVSGSVCGQDPRYCQHPASVGSYEWPDDITQWPICQDMSPVIPENEEHMVCEITGRPCCIQLHGQCRITTREYCDFVQGYFHENATLCSQVSCLGEVCGMLPFMRKDHPNQLYRLFIPLFLHAGVFHCVISVLIQLFYMRDLEKLLGWARMALLFFGAGFGGYLGSAIFVPYKPQVGPAGAHVGLFATMYIDLIYSRNIISEPWRELMRLFIFTLILFFIGTFPWVDNWAQLFGFIFGILISIAVVPYFQTRKRTWRLVLVASSSLTTIVLYVLLFVIFYGWPEIDCQFCEYFNCIPYTNHFCDNQGLRLKSWLPI